MISSVQSWRADTPGTGFRNHLNNAGAALMPRPVITAINDHIRLESEIGGYEAADAQAEAFESGYEHLATLIGCDARNVAVVASATAGFIQALSSFDLGKGDSIITSRNDYTSNQIQYIALRDRFGVEILHAADLPEGGIDAESVKLLLESRSSARKRLVAVSWIPTGSGLVQDVEAVGLVCEEAGVPFIVDACQAIGQIPIDVKRLRCDYLSATARKFLRGPRGIGFMFASARALGRGDHPLFVDMRGAEWVTADSYRVVQSARRFEDWEFPYALVLGQARAAKYALEVGIDTAHDRAWMLAAKLRDALAAIPGARILDRGRTRCAIVTVAFDGIAAAGVVKHLNSQRINAVVSLREYSQLDFTDKGVESAVRLSPHYYNTEEEIDTAVACLQAFVSGL
ncbi:MAG TPA: aminotransferase class V-fold PLP-dependent enzyme [Gemmatimonadaceae bacterium]|nr:aminotransferase class V-fold PLP-dependent enzyme [Gemmatimonadaceae bacterium]